MVRPKKPRKICKCSPCACFRPSGRAKENEIVLQLDEYESIRLKDNENLDQTQAAKKMRVSQPTFCRLLCSARKKIASALVNSRVLRIKK